MLYSFSPERHSNRFIPMNQYWYAFSLKSSGPWPICISKLDPHTYRDIWAVTILPLWIAKWLFSQSVLKIIIRVRLYNYANPVYGVAIIGQQVRWLRWGHPNLIHIATSLLIWHKMFCVRDISYRLIWMEFINMFSVYAQSGTHSRFNW